MIIDLTIIELENLIMMHEYCERHFNHYYAVNAIKKLKKARSEFLAKFENDRAVDTENKRKKPAKDIARRA